MSRPRRRDYDAAEFDAALRGPEPLKVLAARYGVSISALYEAAARRGMTPRRALRASEKHGRTK